MRPAPFERFAINPDHLHVSICRSCLRFIAATPDPVRLAMDEALHACSPVPKKPPASVVPALGQVVGTLR